MMLITKAIRDKLLANASTASKDHFPVVKFFNPCGAATWLISEMDPKNPDILFGLCDLGMGEPELGYVSLAELSSIRLMAGLKIERDLYFEGTQPLSKYAEQARQAGRIVA